MGFLAPFLTLVAGAAQNKMPNYYFATVQLHRQNSLDRMIDDAMIGSANATPTSSSAG